MKKKNIVFAFLLTTIFMILVCNKMVISQTENQIYQEIENVPSKKFILVLGTSKQGKNGLNPYFKNRLEAVIQLYKAGKTESIIVSGDNSIKSYNETEDMANYLLQSGIPASAIIKDYAGFRTLDSVIRAKKVFNCEEMIIVSQQFHNQRALYIANFHGIDAVAFNALDVKSSTNYTHFREYLAKTLVVFDLYFFNRSPKFL